MTTTEYTELPQSARPVAHYAVSFDGDFHWLVRYGAPAAMRISPYTHGSAAQEVADCLNTFVRWEAPT